MLRGLRWPRGRIRNSVGGWDGDEWLWRFSYESAELSVYSRNSLFGIASVFGNGRFIPYSIRDCIYRTFLKH
jgi:hypothetical protein